MAAPKLQELPANPDGKWTVLGVCVLLVVAVFVIFGQTLRHEFVNYDDYDYFTSNYHVKAGLTWKGVEWAFRTGYASNWHPLTWLSLMLDVQFFGTGSAGPHLTNVLLHATNAVLLFLLLRRLMGLRSNTSVGATAPAGTLWSCAFVAAVFAIHPLRVESVAWVVERKDVLSGLFFMLTLLMYARYVEKSKVQSPKSRVYYGLALLFFALGLMSKPMLVTVPFVLLLLDWWPLERITNYELRITIRRLIWEKMPFIGLSAASCVATILVQREAIKSTVVFPLATRLANALISYVTYIFQTVWPHNLAVFYPYRFDIPTWQIAGAGGLLLFITLLAFRIARRFPWFVTGWLWYLGMLVPVIGLMQAGDQSHADRYTYLPQIGLYLVVVLAIRHGTASWRWRRQVLVVTAGMVLAVLMAGAWKQTACWRNNESLWTHTLACTADNYIAHNDLGEDLLERGWLDEAMDHFKKVVKIAPTYADGYYNLGNALMQSGHLGEAMELFRKVLVIQPRHLKANNNLGVALMRSGRPDEAIVYCQKAIDLNPDYAEAHYNLGAAFGVLGRLDEAVEQYRKAIQLKPDYADACGNLANVLATQGKFDEAVKAYQQTLELVPQSAQAHFRFGQALQGQRNFEAAMKEYQKALDLAPQHLSAHLGLAWLLATCPVASLRDGNKAVELGQQAEQLAGSESPQILDTLAAAYAEAGQYPEAIETAKRALNLSATQNNPPLAEAIQARLKLYEAGTAYHEKP
jgi:tetratricopeptide (TPR) repeat protein